MSQVSYVAYIDEFGDDGLARVRPTDPDGASEWFVLGAVVVPADTNREAIWVQDILTELRLTQRRMLHFQPLDRRRQIGACRAIAKLPVRCFTVVSNKRNMRGHANPKAARVAYSAGRTWFYWWMTRLLLERITDYCERRSLHEHKEPRVVRIEFARRDGLRYSHCQGYFYWLRWQSKTDQLFLKQGDLKWSVINPLDEIRVFDPAQNAGLQIADAVAGAFYQAVNGNPDPAIELAPRMAFDSRGSILGYGLKLMPDGYLLRAPAHQRQALDFYAKEKRQAPVP